MTQPREGFEIVERATGDVVDFIECPAGETQREHTRRGLLLKVDAAYYVRDTVTGAGDLRKQTPAEIRHGFRQCKREQRR